MRITKFLAAAVVAGSVFVPQAGAVPPPAPGECKATLEGVRTPADPLGLVQTGSVAVVVGEIVCVRDVLNSTPNETLSTYGGDTTLVISVPGRDVCTTGVRIFSSVGPVLVMHAELPCVIPVSDSARNETLHVTLHWATYNPSYNCCDNLQIDLTPAGVAVQV